MSLSRDSTRPSDKPGAQMVADAADRQPVSGQKEKRGRSRSRGNTGTRPGGRVQGRGSGGSRGGSQGAMDPPFQAEHCMQKQDSQQLTVLEVQQSLPASTPVFSVQSSYKQSLET